MLPAVRLSPWTRTVKGDPRTLLPLYLTVTKYFPGAMGVYDTSYLKLTKKSVIKKFGRFSMTVLWFMAVNRFLPIIHLVASQVNFAWSVDGDG